MHIGYKKCRDGRIVVLEILGTHNENREDIVNKDFAKMRCSKAKVLKIYDMNDEKLEFDQAYGVYNKAIEYRVGSIVVPDEFDPNIDNVHCNGIHYYLSVRPARAWLLNPYDGVYEEWYDNGSLRFRCIYQNGKKHGYIITGYPGDQIHILCYYDNDVLDGLYEEWYQNGIKYLECTFEKGRLHGMFIEQYQNGIMKKRCAYNQGVLHGFYEEWYEDGNVKVKCLYVRGELSGTYIRWDKNGLIKEKTVYNDHWDIEQIKGDGTKDDFDIPVKSSRKSMLHAISKALSMSDFFSD